LGSAACAADTFVTAGLGSAACPLLVGAGILSGQWVGGELGTGARWLRHNISSLWTSGPAQRIAPGPIGEWRYDPNAVA
jgi:hypothetical protein